MREQSANGQIVAIRNVSVEVKFPVFVKDRCRCGCRHDLRNRCQIEDRFRGDGGGSAVEDVMSKSLPCDQISTKSDGDGSRWECLRSDCLFENLKCQTKPLMLAAVLSFQWQVTGIAQIPGFERSNLRCKLVFRHSAQVNSEIILS